MVNPLISCILQTRLTRCILQTRLTLNDEIEDNLTKTNGKLDNRRKMRLKVIIHGDKKLTFDSYKRMSIEFCV